MRSHRASSTASDGRTSSTPALLIRISIPPSAAAYNVESEAKDPNSIYNTYKTLLKLRRTNIALRDGLQEAINDDDANVLCFLRRSGNTTVLIALNMTGQARTLSINWAGRGAHGERLEVLYASAVTRSGTTDRIELAPFSALVAEVK